MFNNSHKPAYLRRWDLIWNSLWFPVASENSDWVDIAYANSQKWLWSVYRKLDNDVSKDISLIHANIVNRCILLLTWVTHIDCKPIDIEWAIQLWYAQDISVYNLGIDQAIIQAISESNLKELNIFEVTEKWDGRLIMWRKTWRLAKQWWIQNQRELWFANIGSISK